VRLSIILQMDSIDLF